MNIKVMLLMVGSYLALLFSCQQVIPPINMDSSFAEFLKENDITKFEDSYTYQGDIIVSEEFVKELYTKNSQSTSVTKGNVITNSGGWNRWTISQVNNLTYSFTTNMATANLSDWEVRNAFRESIANWMAVSDIRVTEVTSGGFISVYTENSPGKIGSAYSTYPNTSNPRIYLNLYHVDTGTPPFDTYAKMVGCFTHEFGHMLGLVHEHQRADSPNTGNQGVTGTPVGNYDPDSVMNFNNIINWIYGPSVGDVVMVKMLYPPTVSPITSGNVTMVSLSNQKYIRAESAGSAPLIASSGGAGSWERFQIINLGNNKCAIKSKINGKYVCAENAGSSSLIANRTAIGSWETFTLVPMGWDLYAIKADANSKYVCADNRGEIPLIANRDAIGGWEIFRIRLY